ncbi:MAG: hypothetical protein Q9161_008409 [Pseudevernia consocians]
MPSNFTSPYVTFGLIGGLFVLLMTFASLLMLMLIGGYCYCLYQPRKIPKRFAGNRRHVMITNLPLPYGDPSDIALLIWLQSEDPSTRLIQHVDSDDSNSTGSNKIKIEGGRPEILRALTPRDRMGVIELVLPRYFLEKTRNLKDEIEIEGGKPEVLSALTSTLRGRKDAIELVRLSHRLGMGQDLMDMFGIIARVMHAQGHRM